MEARPDAGGAEEPRVARFGEFELDRRTLELSRGGRGVKLQRQPARVLSLLVERAGDVVTREELRKAIWADGTVVDFDRGLNYAISQIRAALGDTAETPAYLETLRWLGYRFTAPVSRVERSAAVPVLPAPRSAPALRFPRSAAYVAFALALATLAFLGTRSLPARQAVSAIGVAPFFAPPSERPWAQALHAQLVSRLATFSRTPVVDLADPAREDHPTAWRLEGRVDRSAEQYRVTIVLKKAASATVFWSDVFAGAPGDWLDSQSDLADVVTRAIRYRVEGPSAGLPKRRAFLPPSRSMARLLPPRSEGAGTTSAGDQDAFLRSSKR